MPKGNKIKKGIKFWLWFNICPPPHPHPPAERKHQSCNNPHTVHYSSQLRSRGKVMWPYIFNQTSITHIARDHKITSGNWNLYLYSYIYVTNTSLDQLYASNFLGLFQVYIQVSELQLYLVSLCICKEILIFWTPYVHSFCTDSKSYH